MCVWITAALVVFFPGAFPVPGSRSTVLNYISDELDKMIFWIAGLWDLREKRLVEPDPVVHEHKQRMTYCVCIVCVHSCNGVLN